MRPNDHGSKNRAFEAVRGELLSIMPGKPPLHDEAAAHLEEGEVDVVPTLLVHSQPLEVVEPCQCALHYPAVPPQSLARLDAPAGNARDDVSPPEPSPDVLEVVALVAMPLLRAPSWPASAPVVRGGDGIEERQSALLVVDVRCGKQHCQRTALPVRHDMVLGAFLPSVRGVRAGLGAPLFARMLPESKATRRQSMRPLMPNSSSNCCWRRSKTPARVHASSLRQQVMPLTPNTSVGRSSQAMPVFSMNMMPRSAARSSHRGRPRAVLRIWRGSNGETRFQSASGTSSRLMPGKLHMPGGERIPAEFRDYF